MSRFRWSASRLNYHRYFTDLRRLKLDERVGFLVQRYRKA